MSEPGPPWRPALVPAPVTRARPVWTLALMLAEWMLLRTVTWHPGASDFARDGDMAPAATRMPAPLVVSRKPGGGTGTGERDRAAGRRACGAVVQGRRPVRARTAARTRVPARDRDRAPGGERHGGRIRSDAGALRRAGGLACARRAGRGATPFYDAQGVVDRKLFAIGKGRELRLGGEAWADGQKGVGRVDVGPRASVAFRVKRIGLRAAVDYRARVAGRAAPGSGPALTLSAGF